MLFTGCGRQEPISSPTEKSSKSDIVESKQKVDEAKAKIDEVKTSVKKVKKPVPVVDALAPTSVIVRVNGKDITKGEFAAWERARTKIWAMTRGWKPDVTNAKTKKFQMRNRTRALGELVKHVLIAQYALTEGIEPAKEEIAAGERRFLRSVNKAKSAFSDVLVSLGEEEGELVRRVLRGDAVTMAILENSTSNDLRNVSAEEFTNRVEFVKQWNARADVTNQAVRARAAKAKAEILAGAFFADVAKKYADFAPEQGETWDTFYLDEFEGDNPLGQWLARSDTGDISDPLDLDDGISIVGIKMKYLSPISESNKPPVYAYDVVRCPFYAYETLEDFDGNRKAIVEDIIARRRQLAMRELHDRIVEKAKIEFPSGNNLFYPQDKAKKKGKKKAKSAGKSKSAGRSKSADKSNPVSKSNPVDKTGSVDKSDLGGGGGFGKKSLSENK